MSHQEIMRSYLKYSNKIIGLTEPLQLLGIDIFWRYSLKNDGSFSIIGNAPKVIDKFCGKNLHVGYPYFRHPHFFKGGYVLPELSNSEEYIRTQGQLKGEGCCNHALINIRTSENGLVGFGFASSELRPGFETLYLTQFHLINKFIEFFSNNALRHIQDAESDGIIISKMIGSVYYEKPQLCKTISNSDNEIRFLSAIEGNIDHEKALRSLTKTEKRCLHHYLQGCSTKEIAKKAYRSPRTIESHLQNAKAKLGVNSRSSLFELLLPYQNFL